MYDGGWVNAVVNSKGYVVAAVVMGEAEGVSDNYAYIKSGAYAEEKVGSDHFWDVDVIRDGTIQTMKIKNNYEDTVQNLKVNRVQELVLDTEGNEIELKDDEDDGYQPVRDDYYDREDDFGYQADDDFASAGGFTFKGDSDDDDLTLEPAGESGDNALFAEDDYN